MSPRRRSCNTSLLVVSPSVHGQEADLSEREREILELVKDRDPEVSVNGRWETGFPARIFGAEPEAQSPFVQRESPHVITREQLRAGVREVADAAGLRLVVLFGSAARRARGTARDTEERDPADYDLGVISGDDVDIVDLTNAFIRALGEQAVDMVDLRRADPVLSLAVARDGIPLHEGTPGEFARFHSLSVRRFADTRKFRATEREAIRSFVAARDGGASGGRSS